jgi:glycosyltransferase involved in cell wall biosynthesis
VRAAVREYKPDVVHVHYGLTQIVCSGLKGPRVVTLHGSDLTVWWQKALSTLLLLSRRRDVIAVVVSPHLLERLPGSVRARAHVIGCGVDTAAFNPRIPSSEARHPVGDVMPPGTVLVGFPSSPSRPGKDYALFSETISILNSRGLAVRSRVLDGISPELMAATLRSLDVLLMTSRHEGSPVITREALCCGVRVVSVDVGDVRDQLDGFEGCALVESRDPQALADAVIRSLAGPSPDAQLAARRFDLRREAESVYETYREAIVAAS